MTQEEMLLEAIEARGGSITTYELMNLNPRISQYQARLKGLRQKVAAWGWTLTEAEPVTHLRGCFVYRLIKQPVQIEMFGDSNKPTAA